MANQQTVSEFLQNPAIREQLLQQLERISSEAQGVITYSPASDMGGAPQFGTKVAEQHTR